MSDPGPSKDGEIGMEQDPNEEQRNSVEKITRKGGKGEENREGSTSQLQTPSPSHLSSSTQSTRRRSTLLSSCDSAKSNSVSLTTFWQEEEEGMDEEVMAVQSKTFWDPFPFRRSSRNRSFRPSFSSNVQHPRFLRRATSVVWEDLSSPSSPSSGSP